MDHETSNTAKQTASKRRRSDIEDLKAVEDECQDETAELLRRMEEMERERNAKEDARAENLNEKLSQATSAITVLATGLNNYIQMQQNQAIANNK